MLVKKLERGAPAYRTPHRIANKPAEDPKPVSPVGGGQGGGCLVSFSQGATYAR